MPTKLIADWLEKNKTQLTTYGLFTLHEVIKNNQIAV